MLLFYIVGRGEALKKYGFLPSKAQLLSSSSDSGSDSSDDEHGSMLFHLSLGLFLLYHSRCLFYKKNKRSSFFFFFFKILSVYSNSQYVRERPSGGFRINDLVFLYLCMIFVFFLISI